METAVLRRFANFLIFILLILIGVGGNNENEVGKLPYCGPKTVDKYSKTLIFVSTLDGKVSALDAANSGSLRWTMNTGPGPMLSSSIHRLELTNNGHWVRMIPSLSGGLYKFNGNSIEAIPVSADNLLHSSAFLFSDDLVISGGKESRTYGVSVGSGRVMYECSMKGCDNFTENFSGHAEDVMVVQRLTQTVRAVEARTGVERWNFSVAQHDMVLMPDRNPECHGSATQMDTSAVLDLQLKVIVPEGLVCAVRKSDPSKILWKHKFETPIVAAWQIENDELSNVDLFSGSLWESNYADESGPISPSLYIGMHKKQLYIQESVTMQRSVMKWASNLITDESPRYPRIPWQPIPASSTALGLVRTDREEDDYADDSNQASTTALSILYASEYVNGNGYYLFGTDALKRSQNAQCNVTIESMEQEDYQPDPGNFEFGDDDTPVQIIIVSLWYWWKEVLVISITTAVLVNFMLTQRLFQLSRDMVRQKVIFVDRLLPARDSSDVRPPFRSHSDPGQVPASPSDFTSRYLTDFEPVHCLGKGGFGVVFEAKNKIDDCHYAVKRIPLPNSQESRDRVMREVKALAKLDHPNIVRYFNAWRETPPPGWLEEKDKLVPQCHPLSEDTTSIDLSDNPVKSFAPKSAGPVGEASSSVFLNLRGAAGDLDDSLRLPSTRRRSSTEASDSFIRFEAVEREPDRGDSFIQFETTNGESESWRPAESVINLSSSGGVEGRKAAGRRPASLELTADGGVVIPVVSRMFLFIQMQLCRRESLREWLRDNSTRDAKLVLPMFEQIVLAVEYVHLQGLIHRDLKPSNIFFSMDGQMKIGDFGLVTAMLENEGEARTPCRDLDGGWVDEKHTAQVGTQLYMSPEQSKGLPYNYKVDIYSLGVILFELLVPFGTEMERIRTLDDLRKDKLPTEFQRQHQQEFELLQLMLSHSPDRRPTTYGILARPPFNHATCAEDWHFELPPRRRDSNRTTSTSNSSSTESWELT